MGYGGGGGGGGSGGGGGGSYGGGGGGSSSSASPPTAGAFRFNTDSSQLEIYDGNQWTGVLATSPEQQTGGTRGVYWNSNTSPHQDSIDYINIDTTGNSLDFGNSTVSTGMRAACGSRTRGLCHGGYNIHPTADTIDFITYSSTGNATDFGDLVNDLQNYSGGAAGNQTRGLQIGGTSNATSVSGSHNVISYMTIAATGNSINFGDLAVAKSTMASFNTPTRACIAGGYTVPANARTNSIDYITISTTGNSSEFGDLSTATGFNSAMQGCNAVRAVMVLGNTAPSTYVNTIEYFTMATLGNSSDFGDVSTASEWYTAASSPTRCVWHINASGGGASDKLEYVQIMTTGNGVDFGDMSVSKERTAGCSNGHGGL